MRVALISPPFVPVPPPSYGGTERIVWELARGLRRQGHEVVLFATGDSRVAGVEVRFARAHAEWPPCPYRELEHAAWAAAEIEATGPYDVVHSHVPASLPLERFLSAPLAYTVHHDYDQALARLYSRSSCHLVFISERQRVLAAPLGGDVIHHGISSVEFPFGAGDGGYVLFLGRFSAEKGVHHAIDAASSAGARILLAGRPHPNDGRYFDREIAGRLARPQVEHVGEVGGARKSQLIGGARALLFPIEWEEPFGLVMIEAMFAGTPVLAFDRGSVPEIIDEGITGFICEDVAEMARLLRSAELDRFDRLRCRQHALVRFSADRMVRDYTRLYQQLCREVGDVRVTAPSA